MKIRLFDEIERTETAPARYAQPYFDFMNRSAWREAAAVRALLEGWFAQFPGNRDELRGRFRSPDNRQHLGAFFELPLYDSSRAGERDAVVYMVKTLPDGVRLAFNRNYELLGSVQATPAEWEAALMHSLDTWVEYHLNDQLPGDAVWFEVCGEAREPYRRGWIEGRGWDEERRGNDK